MLLGILLTGEFWVRFWAAAILDFLIKALPPKMPAIITPIITITTESSIREKARFFGVEMDLLFIDEIGFL
jgi:hypothetical protein